MKNNSRISVLNALLIAAVSVASLAAIAIPPARAETALLPAEQCDAEAGSEHDLQHNRAFPAVATPELKLGIGLSACREAVNQGAGPRHQFQLARLLHASGQPGKAFAMLKLAADGGHAAAMVNYAFMLGDRGNHDAAFPLYRQAADSGNIVAAYNLGVAYREGLGTPVNGQLAAKWFGHASDAGSAEGAYNLAVLLDEGTSLPEDNAEAAKFYRIAADRGSVDAMINLALMLENGEGLPADATASLAMFERAAEKGDDFALSKISASTPVEEEPVTIGNEQASLAMTKAGRIE